MKFTLKDFINYNSPCFVCGNLSRLSFYAENSSLNLKTFSNQYYTNITYLITYIKQYSFTIEHKTNKISFTDKEHFVNYFDDINIWCNSDCDNCFSHITSNLLEIDLNKDLLSAFEIYYEVYSELMINGNKYNFSSHHDLDLSTIVSNKFKLELPIIPRSKFKNKQQLIDKIRTYILFS